MLPAAFSACADPTAGGSSRSTEPPNSRFLISVFSRAGRKGRIRTCDRRVLARCSTTELLFSERRRSEAVSAERVRATWPHAPPAGADRRVVRKTNPTKKPRISPGPSVIRENDDPYPRELRARGIRPLPDKPFAMAGVRKYRRSCHFIGTLRAITKGRN